MPDQLSEGTSTVGDAAARPVILLVEDEPSLLRALTYLLVGAGYEVTPTRNGLDALDIVRCAGAIDVVLSDVGLPGLRGDRLATELRRIRPELPVLLMTGFCGAVTPANAASLGVAAVLEKPVEMDDLLAAIEDALLTRQE